MRSFEIALVVLKRLVSKRTLRLAFGVVCLVPAVVLTMLTAHRRRTWTMDRLYTAAVESIGEHGYSETTVDEIVARAGVAKGTVYYHFKSRADLVRALLEDGMQRLASSFGSEIESIEGPADALRALVHAELLSTQRDQAFSRLVISQMRRVDGDWQRDLRLLREQYVSVFAGVITGMVLGAVGAAG